MQTGRAPGERLRVRCGVDAFIAEEGGYTSLAMATALLASLALVFSLAQVQWLGSRSAEVQAVADAVALSGVEPVRHFRTVAQLADATVLSLGLTGLFVIGAGAVTALVPGMGGAGLRVVEAGRSILSTRRDFARSAAQGLQRVEAWLPAAVAGEGWAVARANSQGSVSYVGVALPFPAQGASAWDLADDVEEESIASNAEELAEDSEQAKEAQDEARAALEEGWRADCVDDPSCACSRAASLASLSGSANPRASNPEGWSFGMALLRARAYYAARAARESSASSDPAERTRSAVRKAFYEFAAAETQAGYVRETGDRVEVWLPRLPKDEETTRACALYTQERWPCTQEEGGAVIHSFADCPGAVGPSCGVASLADLESGACTRCEVCGLDLRAVGSVASASTRINNGFEFYWVRIVDASERWQEAENRARELMEDAQEDAEKGADLFERALEALSVPRPQVRPPGYLGVIGVAVRPESQGARALDSAFASGGSLPSGAAMAGACLAPDAATTEDNLLAGLFDSLAAGRQGGVAGVLDGITTLWGQLLLGYGSAYGSVQEAGARLFSGLDAVGAGGVARWLGDRLEGLVAAAGLQPADLRARKPVLCNSQEILSADGSTSAADVRRYLQALPTDGSAAELLHAFGREVVDEIGDQEITLAELTIPGTSVRVPFKVRLKSLWGAS